MSDPFEQGAGVSSLPFRAPKQSDRPYTVTEVNATLARIIEGSSSLVWIQGEISNFKRATSGHCYFTLKDEQSQIPSVMWRSGAVRLKFQPENGMEVMVIASIRVYQKGGYYQIDIQRMQPAGLGALFAAYEQLKKRLEAEGLFDPSRKKPLPETVNAVGVITSKHGAAVRDIIKVIRSRSPQTDIVLIDVAVQGAKAAPQIAQAIRDMNSYGSVDCMIVGRGGGSLEDLWAFNEELVARAILQSTIPVISAVGHEIDFTIADFVADVRAPTPSAAAEMAVPDSRQNSRYLEATAERFRTGFLRFWGNARERYRGLSARPALRLPVRLLIESRQTKDDLQQRCYGTTGLLMQRLRTRIAHTARHLNALSPLQILSRGYSVTLMEDGCTVRRAGQLAVGDEVLMRFHVGEARGRIVHVTEDGRE